MFTGESSGLGWTSMVEDARVASFGASGLSTSLDFLCFLSFLCFLKRIKWIYLMFWLIIELTYFLSLSFLSLGFFPCLLCLAFFSFFRFSFFATFLRSDGTGDSDEHAAEPTILLGRKGTATRQRQKVEGGPQAPLSTLICTAKVETK